MTGIMQRIKDDLNKDEIIDDLKGQISEMQLLLDKANEQLQKGNIPNVMLSRFDEASERLFKNPSYTVYERVFIKDFLRSLRKALASQKISGE